MTPAAFLDKLTVMYASRGTAQYGGEAVSQIEHGLQAAWEAEKSGASAELIVAALLHDVGHLLHGHGDDCADRGLDDQHEELGYRFLTKHFGPAVTEPVRLHVPAKRYLCATEPSYLGTLSEPSVVSLGLQGGPMSPAEVQEFAALPYAKAAITLRRWDDLAKIPGLATPAFVHYRRYLESTLG